MPLASLAQQDFSAGMWRAVARHLIPPTGVWDLPNALLDEDGSPYRRGGSEYLSAAGLGASGLLSLWSGHLAPGSRELFANSADFGTLDAAELPINLGLSGTPAPRKAVELGGVVFVGGGVRYAGSRKTAVYTTGTVSVTQGSTTVTGAGTAWLANADVGMLLRAGADPRRHYVVASIESDTSLTLRDPMLESTGAGLSYALSHIESGAVVGHYRVSDLYAVAASRLWSFEGHRAYFSPVDHPHTTDSNDYHEFTEPLVGGAGLGDRLLAFTTDGVHMVSNLLYDLTDDAGNIQHRNERVGEQILWSHEGITEWHQGLIAPCADHIWIMDGVSQPVPLTLSIAPLYRSYVAAGHKTGLGMTFRSHYVLPVLDSVNSHVDTLVCRLDRPMDTEWGVVFPWTRWMDFTAEISALAIRAGDAASARNPKLLAASLATGSRILQLNSCFGPDVSRKREPDGTDHHLNLTTRDYATGNGRNENTVRRVRLRYELLEDIGPRATTITAVDDVVSHTAHGFENTDRLLLTALTGGAPLVVGSYYYVRDATANTFKLAATEGGAAIDITSNAALATFQLAEDPTISADFSAGQDADLTGLSLWDTATWTDSAGIGGTGIWAAEDAGEWTPLVGQAPEDEGLDPYSWDIVGEYAFTRFARFRFQCHAPSRRLVIRTVEMFVRPSGKD